MKTEERVEKSTDVLTKKASNNIKYSNLTAALITFCCLLPEYDIVNIIFMILDRRHCSQPGVLIGMFISVSVTIMSYAPCGNIIDWEKRCKFIHLIGIKHVILSVLMLSTQYVSFFRPERDVITIYRWRGPLGQLLASMTVSFAIVSVVIKVLFWVCRRFKVIEWFLMVLMTTFQKNSLECPHCQAEIPFASMKVE
ncbi:uncharacterized protein LOC130663928 [Microplitis mediator]|uniref:uncharacterized protein LOC130663928 n=1 Tax=Microplitis mediator TaxID=375433 RepID=UPI0025543F51|nr:uncharacterized protein LOC130663928 [Microplitis mediator]